MTSKSVMNAIPRNRWRPSACPRISKCYAYHFPRSYISRRSHSWRASKGRLHQQKSFICLAGSISCVVVGLSLYLNGNLVPLYEGRAFCDGPRSGPSWPSEGPVVIHRGRRFKSGDTISEDPEPLSQTEVVEDNDTRKESMPIDDTPPEDGPSNVQSNTGTANWSSVQEKITEFLIPDWVRVLPEYITKLQKEVSRAPGSLADMIWQEANDPEMHPEIIWDCQVRISDTLCEEERAFVKKRKMATRRALAGYLDMNEAEIHLDDVPTIAICGSGGGLRALVAGSSSYLCTKEAGLFDCATYTAGVSGSCWLQALYYSSLTGQSHRKLINHLKRRLGVHIAFPPSAMSLLTSAPTDKYLLSGLLEKTRGMPDADFGIVDVYGLLLAARLMVPKGELGVDALDMKVSSQKRFLESGDHPMPIYTCVRHEIPAVDMDSHTASAEQALKETWFQWFEMTPYEFWCEELGAGIPMWALGRSFHDGASQKRDNGLYLPEVRLSTLLGIWGSAFCASLSHYYKEVRPLFKGATGFGRLDHILAEKDGDLIKVHPIEPAAVPNFVDGFKDALPRHVPDSLVESPQLQLMDAGMSNNLPVYPLLRPGRDVDILIAFDASADVRTDNWLHAVDGYARQRGIKGWPVGAGWPPPDATDDEVTEQLASAQAETKRDVDGKMAAANSGSKSEDARPQNVDRQPGLGHSSSSKQYRASSGAPQPGHDKIEPSSRRQKREKSDLTFCNVWVGTAEERESDSDPLPSKLVEQDWELTRPNAGICVIYFPFLSNPRVASVDPMSSDFMSTWNFVYTPDQIDKVVSLARANFEEGKDQTKRTVRAVYERKKRLRLGREEREWKERWARRLRITKQMKHHGGDHFT
ncbi:FabD/lysophospholipase-like protein [Eremomyces bilateralis CBS 781.70]|uniref:Lysophospholipase n=1 Tax=Eremomyces bilateralis CBS 781.70 TaxID=1392243 RepID=A0A6G1G1K7_9PEZI|nr:FabD/lysophospholipase-like protein [Eremomyces bilateralis CBS 781.70]KAF1811811.1 FabD/lysophospholipase-like protein [Eremomyces bilateralis CBS 781.70]